MCLLVFVATTTEVIGTGTAAPVDRTLNLQEARITGKYRLVLERALNRLKLWLTSNHHGALSELAGDTIKFNDVLIDYLQHLYRDQAGVAAGRNCLLSVQNEFRHLKTAFHKAWDSIKSWEMIEPVSLRKPIPHLIVQALAVYGFLRGFSASKPSVACDWISFAVGCLVSFHALLRPGEWGALAARQVAVPARGIQGLTKHALITVLNGKNRRVFGKIQIAILDNPVAIGWLGWLSNTMPDDTRFAPGGAGKFRSLFHEATRALGVGELGLSPGGLRAGGATYMFANEILDIGRLKFRGRWASLHTLEHYVQEATATLVMMRAGNTQIQFLEEFVACGHVFLKPPPLPWPSYFSRRRQRNGFAQPQSHHPLS